MLTRGGRSRLCNSPAASGWARPPPFLPLAALMLLGLVRGCLGRAPKGPSPVLGEQSAPPQAAPRTEGHLCVKAGVPGVASEMALPMGRSLESQAEPQPGEVMAFWGGAAG